MLILGKRDRKRLLDSIGFIERKEKVKRRKIQKILEEEEKIAAKGETYGPGVAPIY